MTRWKTVAPPPETRMLGCTMVLGCLAFAAFLLVLPWLLC